MANKILIALASCAIGLSGCSKDVRQTALTPELLDDQAALARISNRLAPAERTLFNTYVLNRTVGSRIFPNQAMTQPNGKDPATVADAIALARTVQKRNDAQQARNAEITKLEEERTAKLKEISAQQDAVSPSDTDGYNALVARHNATIEEYEAKIKALQALPLPSK